MSSGFTYGGVHSDAFSLLVNKKDIPITPPIESRLQEISGFDGAWDYGVSYAPKPIEIECTILADSKEDLKSKVRRLAGTLNPRKGGKPLIFDDEPDVQYFARLSNQIPLEQLGSLGTFTLQFICPDPFTYAVNVRSGSFATVMNVTHNGTHIARPILTVTHGGGSATITNTRPDGIIETIAFKDDSPSGTYVIDCKEFTITKDGAAAYNFVKGDFISLHEGQNQLANSGAISSTSIEFRDTWL
jgi:predicted phage tail component-like protein